MLDGDVTLDIRVLMEYNGQGKCRKLICYNDAALRYNDKMRTWAKSKNWGVTINNNGELIYAIAIKRM